MPALPVAKICPRGVEPVDRVLITGFPGLVARQLATRLLQKDAIINCLVPRDKVKEAVGQADQLCRANGADRERFILHTGDITMQYMGMGMKTWKALAREIDYVFHTAALSDLSAPPHLAEQVHVLGTDMVNSFCLECRQLKRYVYFSTCYVCGTHKGDFREDDLELGQDFYNHHQRTRHFAEVRVQSLADELPLTILRPATMVGDSGRGNADVSDGLYHLMEFVWRFRRLPLPRLGNYRAAFNLVPVDYVAEAALCLAAKDNTAGSVFQLADPNPRTVGEVYSRLAKIIAGKKPSWRLPFWLLSLLLRLASLERFTGLDRQRLIYQQQHMNFSTRNTREALAGSGIACPDIMAVMSALTGCFLAQHQRAGTKGVEG